jgi:hypothetical protein
MSEFAGTTINERLWKAGLIEKFDAAILARQESTAIALLLRVELLDEQAKDTVAAIFSNPTKYGYK